MTPRSPADRHGAGVLRRGATLQCRRRGPADVQRLGVRLVEFGPAVVAGTASRPRNGAIHHPRNRPPTTGGRWQTTRVGAGAAATRRQPAAGAARSRGPRMHGFVDAVEARARQPHRAAVAEHADRNAEVGWDDRVGLSRTDIDAPRVAAVSAPPTRSMSTITPPPAETYSVPTSGKPLFQAATANLNLWTEAKVDTVVFHSSTWSVEPYCYLDDLFVTPSARGRLPPEISLPRCSKRWIGEERPASTGRPRNTTARHAPCTTSPPDVIHRLRALGPAPFTTSKPTGRRSGKRPRTGSRSGSRRWSGNQVADAGRRLSGIEDSAVTSRYAAGDAGPDVSPARLGYRAPFGYRTESSRA
jgi:hypothetical protein